MSKDKQHGHRHGRMRRAFWIGVGLVAVVLATSALQGCHRGERGRHGENWEPAELREHIDDALDYALDELDADEAQRREITALARELEPTLLRMQGERDELLAAWRAQLEAEQVDADELDRLRERTRSIAARAVDEGTETMARLMEILNAEQRRQLAEHWKHHG